jgi:Flp pilus assembly pilin Flp
MRVPTRFRLQISDVRARMAGLLAGQRGQTTAEYALVILGAAAIATLLITWATESHAISKLFDEVVGKILP